MKLSIRKGFSFGLTSGVITTLGVIMGLHSSTGSVFVVIGGILSIAVADSLSDALGIHISEEAEMQHSVKEIWEATFVTFLSKFGFALTFIIPFLLFSPVIAITINILWGFSLITLLSLYLAKQQGLKPYKVALEHLIIAIAVVVITNRVGIWVATFFNGV